MGGGGLGSSPYRSFLLALQSSLLNGPPDMAARLRTLSLAPHNSSALSFSSHITIKNSKSNNTAVKVSSEKEDSSLGQGQSQNDNDISGNPLYHLEELIVAVLAPCKTLLVLDHIDGLLSNPSGTSGLGLGGTIGCSNEDTATDIKVRVVTSDVTMAKS